MKTGSSTCPDDTEQIRKTPDLLCHSAHLHIAGRLKQTRFKIEQRYGLPIKSNQQGCDRRTH